MEASTRDRERMHQLVNNGQFEFLLGGWCMNDEAASHYTAMLEQNGLGLQVRLQKFKVTFILNTI